jgi:pyrroloquinoline quinone (PQQ) biosynthesis protein C
MTTADRDIIDYVIHTTLDAARTWPWCLEPLTKGSARAFVLQHILRNRFYSAVMRPAWMSRCPDLAIVRKTISQMRQELVYDDAIQAAHTKILWQLGRNIGLTDEQMDNVRPEPLVALFFSSLEDLARNRHWLVGWLGSSIDEFLGGNLAGHNFHADNWMRDLGLSEEQVFFWRYHEQADLDHAGEAVWEPIRRHATSEAVRKEIEQGLVVALEAHRCFYEGIARLGERLDRNSQK